MDISFYFILLKSIYVLAYAYAIKQKNWKIEIAAIDYRVRLMDQLVL